MLIGGILGYVFREKVDMTLQNEMYSSIRFYGTSWPVTQSWDEVQRRLECCGVHSKDDWKDILPDTCCRQLLGKHQSCKYIVQEQNSFILHQRGCYEVTKEFVKGHAVVIGTAGIVVAFLMVMRPKDGLW